MSRILSALLVAVVVVAALDLQGASYAGDLHHVRTELAEARAALRTARLDAATVAPARGLASGASVGARSAGSQGRVRAADRRVREVEAELAVIEAGAGGHGVVTGLLQQVHALVREPRDPATAGRLDRPVRGIVTSGYGPRRLPSWDHEVLHEGIDVFALPGTPVRAAADGVVVAAGQRPRAGLSVTIDHGTDEHGRALRTVYSHLARIDVRVGQGVDARQEIAAVGSTGTHSTGPHLHFEVHLEGEPVDPRAWL